MRDSLNIGCRVLLLATSGAVHLPCGLEDADVSTISIMMRVEVSVYVLSVTTFLRKASIHEIGNNVFISYCIGRCSNHVIWCVVASMRC